ncbi:hypothetical protein BJX68DRAFT_243871 [Aspergillus pseudodeflectus]|uniref:Secreted protein n=1 Tax=Aspergillus pseudodeflectus TaxID=176178 RepID=A0ABR4JU61_9EURO
MLFFAACISFFVCCHLPLSPLPSRSCDVAADSRCRCVESPAGNNTYHDHLIMVLLLARKRKSEVGASSPLCECWRIWGLNLWSPASQSGCRNEATS